MSPTNRLQVLGLTLAWLGATPALHAAPPPKCDKIAQDVTESVVKEPSKVLMIVEDALVINESCACEIIKAAIAASKADAPMVKQIVQTAVAVAPKMAPVIMDCANQASPGAVEIADASAAPAPEVVDTTSGGKGAKNVLPEPVVPPKEGGSDFSGGYGSVRGVYLMAPSGGGFFTPETPEEDDNPNEPQPPKKPRPRVVKPMSPSCTCPDEEENGGDYGNDPIDGLKKKKH